MENKVEENDDDFFDVESVINKRRVGSRTQYLIKWKGFDDSENTWEPEKNLGEDLISEYEAKILSKKNETTKTATNINRKSETKPEKSQINKNIKPAQRKSLPIFNATKRKSDGVNKKKGCVGFARGLQPEKILSAGNSGGKLVFLIKWFGSDIIDSVLSKTANEKCPQVVIKFYEENISLTSVKKEFQKN